MQDMQEIHKHELDMLKEIDEIAKNNNIKYWLAYGTALGAIRHKGFIPWDTDTDIIVTIEDYHKLSKLLRKSLSDKYCYRHIQYDKSYDSLQPRVTLENDHGRIIHVDIYPMVGVPKNFLKKEIFRRIAYLNQRLFFVKNVESNVNYRDKFLKRIISKAIKMILLPIPKKVFLKLDSFLANRYPLNNANEIFNLYGNYGAKEFIKAEWLGEGKLVEFEGVNLPIPNNYDEYLTHLYGDYMTPKKENYI